MGTRIDMIGFQSGRLTVISYRDDNRDSKAYWECRCVCGNTVIVSGNRLRNKIVQSCGCLHHDWMLKYNTKHGNRVIGKTSPEYNVWLGMKDRCVNPNNISYPNYGKRGISVCSEWANSFEQFLNDMGKRNPGESIDRIDNNKGYCKENCKWSTRAEQMSNTRKNKYIEHDGKRLTYSEWARVKNFPRSTISRRIRVGWSPESAINTPLNAASN